MLMKIKSIKSMLRKGARSLITIKNIKSKKWKKYKYAQEGSQVADNNQKLNTFYASLQYGTAGLMKMRWQK